MQRMFRLTVGLFLMMLPTVAHGQEYSFRNKKVGNGTVTEIYEVGQVEPTDPNPKVFSNSPPVEGQSFGNAKAVGKVLEVDFWMDSRRFIDTKGNGWKLVHCNNILLTRPSQITGWHLYLKTGSQRFVTTDGKYYCHLQQSGVDNYLRTIGRSPNDYPKTKSISPTADSR